MNQKLEIHISLDHIFHHKLEEGGVNFKRRDVISGVYSEPLIEYEFNNQQDFKSAQRIFDSVSNNDSDINRPNKLTDYISLVLEFMVLIVMLIMTWVIIDLAIHDYERPEIWISIVVVIFLLGIIVLVVYNSLKRMFF